MATSRIGGRSGTTSGLGAALAAGCALVALAGSRPVHATEPAKAAGTKALAAKRCNACVRTLTFYTDPDDAGACVEVFPWDLRTVPKVGTKKEKTSIGLVNQTGCGIEVTFPPGLLAKDERTITLPPALDTNNQKKQDPTCTNLTIWQGSESREYTLTWKVTGGACTKCPGTHADPKMTIYP